MTEWSLRHVLKAPFPILVSREDWTDEWLVFAMAVFAAAAAVLLSPVDTTNSTCSKFGQQPNDICGMLLTVW
eukprot:CAMPEP_0168728954 /NCGR_PEP_ID=MMETSP0724-20121128/5948_1 /TAXON_ID=265536 /ORGANISM="Amphiprora sp., Strain CCMP467" /LENGTH=71 /DNA_ID=CAMNT_0008775811 /DNA_START=923 /DNA_END=1135 /DNA_ORIENTATION=-